ncbi:uncharacterized protein EKO05_0007267 [Ascochyta rabiei]|uniref:Metal ion binding n=1 Tax=Didymella rabiei TaxID=5454 RepID=A0A163H1W7_DIDRA|nr:uncharacterized protein EKO05_0007267 [Ascochyta rabiei]KZM25118.1 metal ion binding [Ascochyta rabiei]UPX16885.1 hypothetical protein EKO05_0007267 [Ascochyta rabiei]
MTYNRAYDYESIVHYPSILNAQKAKEQLDAPLLKWKNGGRGFTPPSEAMDENTERTLFGRVPTAGDIEALKMMYPWNG